MQLDIQPMLRLFQVKVIDEQGSPYADYRALVHTVTYGKFSVDMHQEVLMNLMEVGIPLKQATGIHVKRCYQNPEHTQIVDYILHVDEVPLALLTIARTAQLHRETAEPDYEVVYENVEAMLFRCGLEVSHIVECYSAAAHYLEHSFITHGERVGLENAGIKVPEDNPNASTDADSGFTYQRGEADSESPSPPRVFVLTDRVKKYEVGPCTDAEPNKEQDNGKREA